MKIWSAVRGATGGAGWSARGLMIGGGGSMANRAAADVSGTLVEGRDALGAELAMMLEPLEPFEPLEDPEELAACPENDET